MKQIKIFGERNTGTVYLEWLLKSNLEITLDKSPILGWKHRLAPEGADINDQLKEEMLFVCLIKNPYPWLLSMHKRPYNHEDLRKLGFADFLSFSFGDYKNPMVMWNKKNNSYVNLGNEVKNFVMVRYEDLLSNMRETMLGIIHEFDLPVPPLIKNINSLITNSHGIKSHKFHKDFYLEEKWKKNLLPHHVKIINEHLDPELMKKFNYSYL